LQAPHTQEPRLINVDKNAAYPKAIHQMNMLHKGQVVGVKKGDVKARTEFVSQIVGVAA
jgi:hypothetical protein